MTHVYCPECGFQNPEAANYCAKCGALLVLVALDERLELVVRDRAEIGEGVGFHGPPSKAALRPRGQPEL